MGIRSEAVRDVVRYGRGWNEEADFGGWGEWLTRDVTPGPSWNKREDDWTAFGGRITWKVYELVVQTQIKVYDLMLAAEANSFVGTTEERNKPETKTKKNRS